MEARLEIVAMRLPKNSKHLLLSSDLQKWRVITGEPDGATAKHFQLSFDIIQAFDSRIDLHQPSVEAFCEPPLFKWRFL